MAADPRSRPSTRPLEFLPALVALEQRPPSPLPRAFVVTGALFLVALIAWSCLGRLDVVVVAPGRLVPPARIQIVQPAEGGVVTDVLVAEGQPVTRGQVLARLERRVADAERDTLAARREERLLDLRRIDAELAGERRLPGVEPRFDRVRVRQAQAQLAARMQSHDARIAAQDALVDRAAHGLAEARARYARVRDALPLLREQADAWEQLVAEGFAGRLQAQERRRAYVESARELEALAAAESSARAALAEAQRHLRQLVSERRAQLLAERAEARTDLDRLEAEWRRAQVRGEQLELRAPRDGVVKHLATRTVGAVLQPGAVLMTLVPSGGSLEAEVRLADADVGFVRPGLRVQLKVGPYPFTRHGVLTGVVRHVAPDAMDETADTRRADVGSAAGDGGAYRVLVALDTEALPGRSGPLPLRAGMPLSAELHLGTRPVIDYVLSPVAKTVAEAGREL